MKSEKGVTITALMITIVILMIIAFTVIYSARGVDEEIYDDILIKELNTVHHIVLEEYNKKLTLGNDYNYIGTTPLEGNESICITTLDAAGKINGNDTFYKLIPENLKSIGAKNASSTYLVCYDTGVVINYTEYAKLENKTNFKLYTK